MPASARPNRDVDFEVNEAAGLKRLFIAWASHHTRTEAFARVVGAKPYFFYERPVSRFRYVSVPFRYMYAGIRTARILLRERPELVFVQDPPIVSVACVWALSGVLGYAFVVDSHTGSFSDRIWGSFLGLYRFLGRRARVNIVHNEPLKERIESWGLDALAIGDLPYVVEHEGAYRVGPGFNAVFVCVFARDEPVTAVIEAARRAPDVTFYVTGDSSRARPETLAHPPPNLVFTGFLAREDYFALLREADVVITLTTKDLTMQNAAYEAMQLAKPVILSDWPVLRETYSKGAVFVDNEPDSLVAALREVQREHPRLERDMAELRAQREVVWREKLAALEAILSA